MRYHRLFFLIALVGCSQAPVREIASAPKLGQEQVPPEEAEATQEILKLVSKGYQNAKPVKNVTGRIIHHKEHGCLKGQFEIRSDLPENLRYGVFSSPQKYEAWVRVSNGSGLRQHDSIPDARGLAIKLMGIEGDKFGDEVNTQDFLLQSAPNFFAKDVAGYVKFMKTSAAPGMKGVGEMLKDTNLQNEVDRKGLMILAKSADEPANPLTAQYFSALPQKLGPHAMKLHARACDSASPKSSFGDRFRKDHLQEILKAQLSKGDGCMEFFIQLQTDAEKMPIENAMVVWDPALSPFVSVAKIHIPKQDFLTPKRKEFCENVSFNPWHSLKAHRPLGGLNRVRKLVYEQSQSNRHRLNNEKSFEPKAGESYE